MDGVYTLWSRPKNDEQVRLSQVEILLLAASVAEWRRWHGRAVLFCDHRYGRYLEEADLLGLWDRVDTETLNEPGPHDVDARTFWTYGRFQAIANIEPPFVSIDCDLVMWRSFQPDFAACDIAFTHWEATNDSAWYPPPDQLTVPAGYALDPFRDWSLRAANVSTAFFGEGTAALRDRHVAEFLQLVTDNPARTQDALGVAPELLFAEQRLLPVLTAEENRVGRALIDATWSPLHNQFITHDQRFGPWDPLGVLDQPAGITHAWFHKRFISPGDPVHTRLVSELSTRLRTDHPQIAEQLNRRGNLEYES